MAEVIRMPKMSDTMTEGVIVKWHKKVGDYVKPGDLLAEVETDKATMELESYQEGILLHIGVQEKAAVLVDALLAIIGKKGEDFSALLNGLKTSIVNSTEKTEIKKENSNTLSSSSSTIKASIIRMPKMSDTMTEGTIVAWHKKVGDTIKSGDLLAEVETDKATMELESYETGTLLYIGVKTGEVVKVDAIIAIIGEKEANYQELLKASSLNNTASVIATENKIEVSSAKKTDDLISSKKSTSSSTDSRVKISPLAKKLAQEKGINLLQVKGSGDNGRIIKRDVENYTPSSGTKSMLGSNAVTKESYEEVVVSQMRKAIARRLSESKFSAPHFYLTMEINMDKVMEMRKSVNEVLPIKISFNDIVIKAVAAALRINPKVNASWLGDKIRYNHHIHIGVAVAIEDGLIVPVLRFADSKSLAEIATEVKELGVKAKNKQLQPADWEGNTFTISNLGMFGIEEFTAIINPPDACILAVGGIKETAVVKNGQLQPGHTMKVTLSCDHRVVDGALGAAFLQTLKQVLEEPIRLVL